MKLFSPTLEDDALDWFTKLPNWGIKTKIELFYALMKKWGDRKDDRHILASLNTTKKNENETMEEFNKRFNGLIQSLSSKIKPTKTAILIHYIESLNGEMSY